MLEKVGLWGPCNRPGGIGQGLVPGSSQASRGQSAGKQAAGPMLAGKSQSNPEAAGGVATAHRAHQRPCSDGIVS